MPSAFFFFIFYFAETKVSQIFHSLSNTKYFIEGFDAKETFKREILLCTIAIVRVKGSK